MTAYKHNDPTMIGPAISKGRSKRESNMLAKLLVYAVAAFFRFDKIILPVRADATDAAKIPVSPNPPQPMAIALIAIRARLLHFRDRRNRLLTPAVEALSTYKS
jgi:hypothetical protein